MLITSEHQIRHAKPKSYSISTQQRETQKSYCLICLLLVKERNCNKQQQLHQFHQ